jgi:hypothetical protein
MLIGFVYIYSDAYGICVQITVGVRFLVTLFGTNAVHLKEQRIQGNMHYPDSNAFQ